jgi:predicted amidohydrolase YtcJ
LTLDQVLDAYTSGAAYAQWAEKQQGALRAGLLADLAIWDRDLFAMPPSSVHQAQIKFTLFDGKIMDEGGSKR